MADEEQLKVLRQGTADWNAWRERRRPWVNLVGADLSEAMLRETVLADLDLSTCKGLENYDHNGPSVVDIRTLQRSGVGLPDALIDNLPSLLKQLPGHAAGV